MPTLSCPHCGFGREVPAERLAPGVLRVRCPRCQQGFEVDGDALLAAPPAPEPRGGTRELDFEGGEGEAGLELDLPPAPPAPAAGAFDLPPDPGVPASMPSFQPVYDLPARAAAATAGEGGAVVPAGFGSRAVAAILDGVGCWLVLQLLGSALGGTVRERLTALAEAPEVQEAAAIRYGVTFLLLALVVTLGWYVIPTALFGWTLGKKLLGMKVVTADGDPPGLLRVLFRELAGKSLSQLVCGVGYLLPLFDPYGRALHDHVAQTLVVKA